MAYISITHTIDTACETGLVISTQKPQGGQVNLFNSGVAQGKTGKVISKLTGFPLMYMHRNHLAKNEDLPYLNQIQNNSRIIITGHGKLETESVAGLYNADDEIGPVNVEVRHPLQDYVDLIAGNHTKLKKGDTITVVLWVCSAAQGGQHSTAAKFATLLKERGLNPVVIAHTGTVQRFGGSLNTASHHMLYSLTPDTEVVQFKYDNKDELQIIPVEELMILKSGNKWQTAHSIKMPAYVKTRFDTIDAFQSAVVEPIDKSKATEQIKQDPSKVIIHN